VREAPWSAAAAATAFVSIHGDHAAASRTRKIGTDLILIPRIRRGWKAVAAAAALKAAFAAP